MVLSGYVYDNDNGNGIAYASIMITDSNGNSLSQGTAANSYGYFELSSPLLDGQAWLFVSSTGYQPILINSGVFQESGDIGLDRSGNLDAVTVTAPQKRSDRDWIMFLIASGGIGLLVYEGERRRKVTGVTATQAKEWVKLGLQIGIPIALIFLVVKPILQKLGLWPTETDRAQAASDKEAKLSQEDLAVYNAQQNHTYNQTTLDSIAVQLRNSTLDWWGYEWGDIAKDLAYFTGFTVADARYFLGTFVKKNGYTLWQWYFQEFEDAAIFTPFDWDKVYWQPGWGGTGAAYDYRANYSKMGINESNASTFTWDVVVEKFVSYLYDLSGVGKQ